MGSAFRDNPGFKEAAKAKIAGKEHPLHINKKTKSTTTTKTANTEAKEPVETAKKKANQPVKTADTLFNFTDIDDRLG